MRLNIPTVAEVNAKPHATPKHQMVSRVKENGDDAKADKAALAKWAKKVYERDEFKCRVCEKAVVRTLALLPNKAHPHHIKGRADKSVRHDRRNGLTCCPGCHERLEHNELVILQGAKLMFELDGQKYINADNPLRIVEKKS